MFKVHYSPDRDTGHYNAPDACLLADCFLLQAQQHATSLDALQQQFHQRMDAFQAQLHGTPQYRLPPIPQPDLATCRRYMELLTKAVHTSPCSPSLARFSSQEQLMALHSMLSTKDDAIVVLRTGGGKSSLLYALSMAEPDKITIVVVPHVALLHDLQRRGRELRAQVCCWRARGDTLPRSGLVLVGAEEANERSINDYVSGLSNLARVVMDEAHELICSGGYRSALHLGLIGLGRGVQIVCMSGTLPPSYEQPLLQRIDRPRARVIRSPTTARPNLTYTVSWFCLILFFSPQVLSI